MSAFSRNLASAGMHPAQDVDYRHPMPGPESLIVHDPVLLSRRGLTTQYREAILQQGATDRFEPAQERYLAALTATLARPQRGGADAPTFTESVVLLLVGEREARLKEADMIYAEQTADTGLQRRGEDAWRGGPIHRLSRRVVATPSAHAIAQAEQPILNELVAEAINHTQLLLPQADPSDVARYVLDVLLAPTLHDELDLLRSAIDTTRARANRTLALGSLVTQTLQRFGWKPKTSRTDQ